MFKLLDGRFLTYFSIGLLNRIKYNYIDITKKVRLKWLRNYPKLKRK